MFKVIMKLNVYAVLVNVMHVAKQIKPSHNIVVLNFVIVVLNFVIGLSYHSNANFSLCSTYIRTIKCIQSEFIFYLTIFIFSKTLKWSNRVDYV